VKNILRGSACLPGMVFAGSCWFGGVNAPLCAQQPTKPALPVRPDTTARSARVWKILGVFDDQGPIDSVEVRDIITGTHALTTSTGTVALSFLSRPTGTRILLRKIGYNAFDTTVTTGPADTVPLIVVMTRVAATALPTVVTSAKATSLSSNLRGFEERVSSGSGARFITPDQMRREPDGRRLADLLLSHGIRPGSRGPSLGRCRLVGYQNGVPYWWGPEYQGSEGLGRGGVLRRIRSSTPAICRIRSLLRCYRLLDKRDARSLAADARALPQF
jgi:hypothetical protein